MVFALAVLSSSATFQLLLELGTVSFHLGSGLGEAWKTEIIYILCETQCFTGVAPSASFACYRKQSQMLVA